MNNGIWLPNTINGVTVMSFLTVDAKASREEALVLFVLDDELACYNDLHSPLDVVEGEFKHFGCRTIEMSLQAFTLETLDELPSHLVFNPTDRRLSCGFHAGLKFIRIVGIQKFDMAK